MTDKHEDDLKRVDSQNNVTDFVRGVEEGPQGWFVDGIVRSAVNVTPYGRAVAARTDFEKRDLDLNEMIDLVEQTDPEDLESSGKALWDARDAIKKAADDLNGHIDKVEWVGQAGQAFRTWGRNLVTNTHHLSEFAGAAGDQITAAAVGLASVRGAMPARDSHPSRKRPEKFTTAEKAANKEDYAAAVKVEKERQEAINQMNRLSSYYAVSEEVLSALPAKGKTPEFASMPDVGVPRPQPGGAYEAGRPVAAAGPHGSTGSTSVGAHHATVADVATGHVPSDVPSHTKHIPEPLPHTDQPVGTNIDSTGTLPPPTTTSPAPGHTPPVTGTTPAGGGQPNIFEGPVGTPIPSRASGRGLSGAGGFRTPPSAQGRAGTSGLTNPGSGRGTGQGPMSQMGRAASTGQQGLKGTASGSKSLPMGRGVTGGTPRPGGAAASRATGGPSTGAGRSNGVVGGRPTATGGASSKGGARIPRGTVIGGEEAAGARGTVGRPGQRGVFGASESTARPGANAAGSRAAGGTPEAVTGRPAARNSMARAERNGLTRGGSGLVRGPGGSGKPGDEEEAQGSERPDYLVEDEETHLPDKPRRDVPPVVN
ncbi:hypothetical protein PV343_35760 [Streptomyces sp. WI03-4A]|uniref:hypothetical protein n=1 Tax=Streptomyces sp. WI03-4A TaxID=3028706 RepID=UPI0029B3385D|nr:hypothetical protein [Streptomyces sp. WI03-4A]MDX2597568.1 hypothetical protein [Streptomyces sp. WI03-4A]